MKTSYLIGISRHRIGVDGEGVTTLVAFHECPLRCQYCLNPKALSPNGVWKRYTPEELYNHVKQDDLYFLATGGGVTFGGGEPLISSKRYCTFTKITVRVPLIPSFNTEADVEHSIAILTKDGSSRH